MAEDVTRAAQVYRAETEGVGRMVGVHEPECIGLDRDDDLAGQCDCRTIRMLVIEIMRERLPLSDERLAQAEAKVARVEAILSDVTDESAADGYVALADARGNRLSQIRAALSGDAAPRTDGKAP